MPDYYFPKMDRTVNPDWQAWVKVAVTLAKLRGHPIEQVLGTANPYPQDWPTSTWDTDTQTVAHFEQALTTAEQTAVEAIFANPATTLLPGLPGWGPDSGFTRLKIKDIYANMAAFIVTGAGLPSNSCTIWVDRSSPAIPNEEWDLLYLDFDRDLTLQQRRSVESAFAALITWILT